MDVLGSVRLSPSQIGLRAICSLTGLILFHSSFFLTYFFLFFLLYYKQYQQNVFCLVNILNFGSGWSQEWKRHTMKDFCWFEKNILEAELDNPDCQSPLVKRPDQFLSQFSTSCLCQLGFSTLNNIKNKKRERLWLTEEETNACLLHIWPNIEIT